MLHLDAEVWAWSGAGQEWESRGCVDGNHEKDGQGKRDQDVIPK